MALTKVTGSVIKDSVSLSGNVSVGGTLTYQDVTNVDALGIGTFRTGVKVLAGGINAVGVITATSFVGSGAQLTGITGTTINTNADNRIITGSGTANTLNGEANLTWNGTAMAVGHNNPSDTLHVYHATDNYVARFESGDAGGGISLKDNTHTSTILSSNGAFSIDVDNGSDVSGETIAFKMSGSEKVRIDSSGRMGLGTNSPTSYDNEAKNLVVASADHTGITIASTGSSKRNNLYFADGTSGNAAYRGAITYDHNIDDLYVRTAGVERLRITSAGHVLKPKNPRFSYARQTGWVTVSGSNTVISWDQTLSSDPSSSYNSGNGRFTAPVAGSYCFLLLMYTSRSDASQSDENKYMNTYIRKNGSSPAYSNNIQHYYNAGDLDTSSTCHMMLDLAQNDYVDVVINANGTDFRYYGYHCAFSGWLVG